jgi:hypothetical protein
MRIQYEVPAVTARCTNEESVRCVQFVESSLHASVLPLPGQAERIDNTVSKFVSGWQVLTVSVPAAVATYRSHTSGVDEDEPHVAVPSCVAPTVVPVYVPRPTVGALPHALAGVWAEPAAAINPIAATPTALLKTRL